MQWKSASTTDLLLAFSFCPIIIDSLTKNTRKEATWQMMLVDDVVFCAREKDVLDVELEQWRAALENSGTKVSRAKT